MTKLSERIIAPEQEGDFIKLVQFLDSPEEAAWALLEVIKDSKECSFSEALTIAMTKVNEFRKTRVVIRHSKNKFEIIKRGEIRNADKSDCTGNCAKCNLN